MTEDNEAFRKLFANNIINLSFMKKDGTKRNMRCTLINDYLPNQMDIKEAEMKRNPDVLAVWDLDKNAWRSFRLDSIISYSVEGEYKEAI